ncbi:hypothetical protein [Phaeobacter sp.]|uniref:shikimate dehydrogenase family protein n=1 Tax=Phaeobacter sp. TaxID=1902409 RepID=UPI0025DA1A03|nr:hypothetical protein [Phaeobacter sp.]
MGITGKTKIFPIIGRPVETVFSPPAYNTWFAEHGLDVQMLAMDVAPDTLPDFLRFMRSSESFLGCSVTYPYKQDVFEFSDDKTDRAERLGALNTLRRLPDGTLSGDATDGLAMVGAIKGKGVDPSGRSALILGAGGGAGWAIADALCEAGLAQLSVVDIDAGRVARVTNSLQNFWPEVAVQNDPKAKCDILVNATILGKSSNDPLPFGAAQIEATTIVCDVVTGDGDTELIKLSKNAQKFTVDGSDMGRCQLEPQLRFLGLYR